MINKIYISIIICFFTSIALGQQKSSVGVSFQNYSFHINIDTTSQGKLVIEITNTSSIDLHYPKSLGYIKFNDTWHIRVGVRGNHLFTQPIGLQVEMDLFNIGEKIRLETTETIGQNELYSIAIDIPTNEKRLMKIYNKHGYIPFDLYKKYSTLILISLK